MGRPRLARPAALGHSDAGQSRRVGASRPARRGTRRTQSSACHLPQADHRPLSRVRSLYGTGSSRTLRHRPAPGWPTGEVSRRAPATAKAAMESLCRYLAVALATRRITVNAVSPGATEDSVFNTLGSDAAADDSRGCRERRCPGMFGRGGGSSPARFFMLMEVALSRRLIFRSNCKEQLDGSIISIEAPTTAQTASGAR